MKICRECMLQNHQHDRYTANGAKLEGKREGDDAGCPNLIRDGGGNRYECECKRVPPPPRPRPHCPTCRCEP